MNTRGSVPSRTFVVLGTLLVLTASAPAGTNGFTNPWFRGLLDTEYAGWETFTVPFGPPGNQPMGLGINTGDGTLFQSDPNALITGSGNIYNLNGVSSFTLSDSAPLTLGLVVLQVRTLGSELDYNSVHLLYDDGNGPQQLFAPRTELDRAAGFGVNVSSRWEWDVTALGIAQYDIVFSAATTSLSLDAITLDTAALSVVPEPADTVWVALGGLGLLLSGCEFANRRARKSPRTAMPAGNHA